MDKNTKVLLGVTMLAGVAILFRMFVQKSIKNQIRKALPDYVKMAQDYPSCVPQGVIFDLAHLDTITAKTLTDFVSNIKLQVIKDLESTKND